MTTELNQRQILFVYHYLNCWNATKAAIAAGYSKKTAYSQGHDLLKKPEIESFIANRVAEKAMPADEVLARLADMARGSIDDVIDSDDEFDLNLARETGKMHLVKKFKRTTKTDKDGNTFRTTEVELYDAQAALVHIGKHLKLFSDVVEIKDWREQARKDGYDPDKLKARLEAEFIAAMVSTSGDGSVSVGTGDDSGEQAGE